MRERPGRELLAWTAQAALYGFGYLRPRARAPGSPADTTIVFVHGLAMNRASFFPLRGYLRLLGYRHQRSPNFGIPSSITEMAADLGRFVEREVPHGRIDLVCHSMGGLAARWYLQALGGDARVDHLVTLATPHHGTYLAANAPSELLVELAPDGGFIEALRELPPLDGVECFSIAAGQDLLVTPGDSALAPFGETIVFDDLGHMDVLLSPHVFAAVHLALEPGFPNA